MSGPIFPGDGDPRHGTENGYQNLKCRCGDCREAHRLYYNTHVVPNHPEYAERTKERARRLRRQAAEAEGRTIQPPIDVEAVRQLASEGMTAREIAKWLNRSYSGVRSVCRRHGITPPLPPRHDPTMTALIEGCIAADMSYVEAAMSLGMSENGVRTAAWRRGLVLRDGRRKREAQP